MFDRDDAIAIQKAVEIEKIKLWRNNKDYILNEENQFYIYSDVVHQANHIKEMIKNGWIYAESKKKEGIYVNYMNEKDNVYILCGCFYRKIINL